MGKAEDPIHISILNYLRMRYPRALIFHPANEMNLRADPKSKAIAQNRAKAMGMMPGIPDLIMLHDATFYSFEVKSPKGTLADTQRMCAVTIKANGGHWFLVRSIDEVRAAMAGVTG